MRTKVVFIDNKIPYRIKVKKKFILWWTIKTYKEYGYWVAKKLFYELVEEYGCNDGG